MRVLDAVCLVLAVGVAGYVYNVKHEAEIAQAAKRALERDIAIVSRDVHLLEADLAALDHPGRMQALVRGMDQTVDLEPIEARHFVRLTDIPFRSDLAASDGDGAGPQTPVADIPDPSADLPGTGDAIAGLLATDGAPEGPTDALDALLEELLVPMDDDSRQVTVPAETEASRDGIAALLEDRP